MLSNWLLAYRFMRGYPFRVRFVFACFFMFEQKYRTMPLTPYNKLDAAIISAN